MKDDGRLAVGVDVGGTKTEIILAGRGGRKVAEHRIPTEPENGAETVLARAAQAARSEFGAGMRGVATIGISVAGQVSPRGVLIGAPNLGWHGVDVRGLARKAFDLPVLVANDVRSATWAEWRLGGGRGVRDLLVLFLGTGVGGGAVIGGRLLEGSGGVAGEFGHLTVIAGGRQCRCGNRGCLEAYCGGWAIEERAREAALAHHSAGAALIRAAGGADAITGESVAAALRAGDALAQTLIDDTAEVLGAALVGLVNGLNPRRVILGGGVLDGFPELRERAAAAVRDRALPAAREKVDIVQATLRDDAPALGAADLALSRLRRR
ncbi:MAG TPA: ROK family protein [Longimicrobium sp.]